MAMMKTVIDLFAFLQLGSEMGSGALVGIHVLDNCTRLIRRLSAGVEYMFLLIQTWSMVENSHV
jgi:hypothetical protein